MPYDPFEQLPPSNSKTEFRRKRLAYRSIFSDHRNPQDGNFKCQNCHNHVVQMPYYSGVSNRNHCPYCLWSKHVDLNHPGDRLSACKALMQPIGLALKKTNKKYGGEGAGELMLIHQCVSCSKVSINRIAGDDLASGLYAVFRDAVIGDRQHSLQLEYLGIKPLRYEDKALIEARLFGFGNKAEAHMNH